MPLLHEPAPDSGAYRFALAYVFDVKRLPPGVEYVVEIVRLQLKSTDGTL